MVEVYTYTAFKRLTRFHIESFQLQSISFSSELFSLAGIPSRGGFLVVRQVLISFHLTSWKPSSMHFIYNIYYSMCQYFFTMRHAAFTTFCPVACSFYALVVIIFKASCCLYYPSRKYLIISIT